jgi:hypothetical protein
VSSLGDLETAVRAELAKPETRVAIEGIEHVVLEAVKAVLETAIPAWLRPIVGGLVDMLAEKGITEVEHLTDKALSGLAPVAVQVGAIKLALRVEPAEASLTAVDTVADWPGRQD